VPSEEEELVNYSFHLEEDESSEFVIGHIEQGDTLKIFIESEDPEDTYKVELFAISKELSRTLLALKVKSGKATVYRVPLSVDAIIKITSIYTSSGNLAKHRGLAWFQGGLGSCREKVQVIDGR